MATSAGQEAISALDRIDPDLGIFIEFDADRVLTALRNARPGRLSGVLIGIKDLVDTAGIQTTYGSEYFRGHIPEKNAPIIDFLESQGAVVVGKTNCDEFAHGVSGYNPHYGPTLNPKDHSRVAGGSSSGSAAAVAAGVCRVALGTDTSGSVRIPAACCGIYGIKLFSGALPMGGVWPLSKRYDSLGYLAAGIEDLQQVLNIPELPDPGTIRTTRLGVDREVPEFPLADHWTSFREGAWDVHAERYTTSPERYGKNVLRELSIPFDDLLGARQRLRLWRQRFVEAVADFDVLIGPLFDGISPTLSSVVADYENDQFMHGDRLMRLTPIYNELDWVALTVPTLDGPIQVAGRPGNEPAVLSVGNALGLPSSDTVL